MIAALAGAASLLAEAAEAGRERPLQLADPSETAGSSPTIFDELLDFIDLDFSIGPWRSKAYVQVDAANYDQAPAGPPETDFRRGANEDGDPLRARALNSGAILRRARIGGEGTWGMKIAYRLMLEIPPKDDEGQPRVAEAWVRYRLSQRYTVTLGAFPQIANLADTLPADSTLFMERPTAADLSRNLGAGDGRVGLMLRRADPRWMTAVSLTGPLIDHAPDFTPRSAVVFRSTRAVRLTADTRIQLGVSGTRVLQLARTTEESGERGFPIRLRSQPEIKVDDTRLIDTGELAAEHAGVIGLEFAAQRRNLLLQGEIFRFAINRKAAPGIDDPHFTGFYVEGSWVLTGERRRFDTSRGAFNFPKPNRPIDSRGWGAWEAVARYSVMDLNYREGQEGQLAPMDGVRGGEQRILALGLEWYPRQRFRVMFNYLNVRVDRLNPASVFDPQPFGAPPLTPPIGVQIGQDLNIFAIRGRYGF